jgi:DNA repair protein RadC
VQVCSLDSGPLVHKHHVPAFRGARDTVSAGAKRKDSNVRTIELFREAAPGVKPSRLFTAKEWKVVCLRETPLPDDLQVCDTPDRAADYWRSVIATDPRHKDDCESFYVLFLNTRRRVAGHALVSHGTLDTILVHPREVFRPAIVANAAAIILMHNHPSGDPSPSEADVKVTRDLIRGGQMLKIDVLDHVVMGMRSKESANGYVSLRELGYFYS